MAKVVSGWLRGGSEHHAEICCGMIAGRSAAVLSAWYSEGVKARRAGARAGAPLESSGAWLVNRARVRPARGLAARVWAFCPWLVIWGRAGLASSLYGHFRLPVFILLPLWMKG